MVGLSLAEYSLGGIVLYHLEVFVMQVARKLYRQAGAEVRVWTTQTPTWWGQQRGDLFLFLVHRKQHFGQLPYCYTLLLYNSCFSVLLINVVLQRVICRIWNDDLILQHFLSLLFLAKQTKHLKCFVDGHAIIVVVYLAVSASVIPGLCIYFALMTALVIIIVVVIKQSQGNKKIRYIDGKSCKNYARVLAFQ